MGVIKWIKLFTGIHDDEKMKIIDAMEKRDLIHYFWIRLLIQAAKTNSGGRIFLDENTPYTREILSILFNRPIDLIEHSLNVLVNLKMIEIYENGVINIVNWNKHQNIEGMDRIREQTRKRVDKYRSKDKDNTNELCNVTVTKQNKTKNETQNKKKIENKTKNKNKTGLKIEEVSETDGNNIESQSEFKEAVEGKSFTIGEENSEKEKLDESDIIDYIKKLDVKIRGSNLSSIKSAVLAHGSENVRLAIDKAIEVDRPRMNYINGILNNWRVEGYPNSSECSNSKSQRVLRFNNFEPRKYDYEKLEKELLGWERD